MKNCIFLLFFLIAISLLQTSCVVYHGSANLNSQMDYVPKSDSRVHGEKPAFFVGAAMNANPNFGLSGLFSDLRESYGGRVSGTISIDEEKYGCAFSANGYMGRSTFLDATFSDQKYSYQGMTGIGEIYFNHRFNDQMLMRPVGLFVSLNGESGEYWNQIERVIEDMEMMRDSSNLDPTIDVNMLENQPNAVVGAFMEFSLTDDEHNMHQAFFKGGLGTQILYLSGGYIYQRPRLCANLTYAVALGSGHNFSLAFHYKI